MERWTPYAVAIGGAAVAWWLLRDDVVLPGCRSAPNEALARAYAEKWGPVFGAPVSSLMTLARIESGFRADCAELSARALARGGAYGLVQQTLATAKGHAAKLAGSGNADVQRTLAAKWHGSARDLLDPDLNMMLAAYHVGVLTDRYGDFKLVAAAYHQGTGKVDQMIRDGKAIPSQLPPKGKAYVTRALDVHERYA